MDSTFFKYITLFVALMLATISGVFSVIGMMQIFASLPLVGMALGSAIEIGKLTGISWLYRYWPDKVWFRHFFAACTIAAMLVTSVGVYGMLSKAHSSNTLNVSDSISQIELIDNKILSEQQKISRYEKIISDMDAQVDVLVQHSKISTKGGAVELSKMQEDQRKLIGDQLAQSQNKIDELRTEKLEKSQIIRQNNSDIETVVNLSKSLPIAVSPETALNVIIVLIMLSLDPMAIMLLMGFNHIAIRNPVIAETLIQKEIPIEIQSPTSSEDLADDEVTENIEHSIEPQIEQPRKRRDRYKPTGWLFHPDNSQN